MMPCSGEAAARSQAAQLALGFAAGLLRQAGGLDALPKLGQIAVLILFAQLRRIPAAALQEVLALGFRHPLAGLGGDLLAQLADGQLVLEQLDQPLQLGVQHVLFQQLLADRPGQRGRGRDEIHQLAWVFERLGGAGTSSFGSSSTSGTSRRNRSRTARAALGLDAGESSRGDGDARLQVWLGLREFAEADPLKALDHQADGAVRLRIIW